MYSTDEECNSLPRLKETRYSSKTAPHSQTFTTKVVKDYPRLGLFCLISKVVVVCYYFAKPVEP